MAEYALNSELSGDESKHDGKRCLKSAGGLWCSDAEGGGMRTACGSRRLRFGLVGEVFVCG